MQFFRKKAKAKEANAPHEVAEIKRVLSDNELYLMGSILLPRTAFSRALTKEQILHLMRKVGIEKAEELIDEVLTKFFYRLGATNFDNKIVEHNAFRINGQSWQFMRSYQSQKAKAESKEVLMDIYPAFLNHRHARAITPDQLAEALIKSGYKVDDMEQVKLTALNLSILGLTNRSIIRSEHGYLIEISNHGFEFLRDSLPKSERIKCLPNEYQYTPSELAEQQKSLSDVIKRVHSVKAKKQLTF